MYKPLTNRAKGEVRITNLQHRPAPVLRAERLLKSAAENSPKSLLSLDMKQSEQSFYIVIIQIQNEETNMLDARRHFTDSRSRYPGINFLSEESPDIFSGI
jgi:hypothetical protein